MKYVVYVGMFIVCYFVNYALCQLNKLNNEIDKVYDEYVEANTLNEVLKILLVDALVGSQVMAKECSVSNINDYYLSICDCRVQYDTNHNVHALVVDYEHNGKINSIEI